MIDVCKDVCTVNNTQNNSILLKNFYAVSIVYNFALPVLNVELIKYLNCYTT